MAHFAQLDENNVVLRVIVVNNNEIMEYGQENEAKGVAFCQSLFPNTNWKQTSYNKSFRKNFAGIYFTYDEVRNAFLPPKPFSSWLLNEDSAQWEPPIAYPNDGKIYTWDETTTSWQEVYPVAPSQG